MEYGTANANISPCFYFALKSCELDTEAMFATTAASVVSLPPDVSQKSSLHNVTQNKTQKIFSLIQARCSRNGAKIPNLNPILKEVYVLLSKEVSVIPKAVIGGHITSQKYDLKVLRKQVVNTYSPQHAVNSINIERITDWQACSR